MGAVARRRDLPLAGTLRRIAASVDRRPVLTRWLLAGPGALAAAVLVMAAMPVWLPGGSAGVDNIVWPIVLAPLIWTAMFAYAVIEAHLPRGVAVISGTLLLNGGLVAMALAGPLQGAAS